MSAYCAVIIMQNIFFPFAVPSSSQKKQQQGKGKVKDSGHKYKIYTIKIYTYFPITCHFHLSPFDICSCKYVYTCNI